MRRAAARNDRGRIAVHRIGWGFRPVIRNDRRTIVIRAKVETRAGVLLDVDLGSSGLTISANGTAATWDRPLRQRPACLPAGPGLCRQSPPDASTTWSLPKANCSYWLRPREPHWRLARQIKGHQSSTRRLRHCNSRNSNLNSNLIRPQLPWANIPNLSRWVRSRSSGCNRRPFDFNVRARAVPPRAYKCKE